MMSQEQELNARIARLPTWARSYIFGLNREIERLRAERELPTDPWVFEPTLPSAFVVDSEHGRPLVGGNVRSLRIVTTAGWVEVSREREHLKIRGEYFLIVQPESGNVVKVASAGWL